MESNEQACAVGESNRTAPGWLLLLFFGSGCAALIYEIVWFQLLQLILGLTTISLGVLLAAFMGGMSAGSGFLARVVSSRRHPLRVYAALELGIGLLGLAILWLSPWGAKAYTAAAGGLVARTLFRGLLAAVFLLPPTLLMGATLPAMARWVESTPAGMSRLGLFYGGNTAGAVLGCLLAGFYLLRVHDMAFATYVAVAINLAVAVVAWALAAKTPRREEGEATGAEPAGVAPGEGDPGAWPVLAAIALSGATALGAEVVWTRLLSLVIGGTVYTFSLILAVFLAGIGLGGGLGAVWARTTRSPRLALGACQALLLGAVAWAACMIAGSLPYWPVNPALAPTPWFNFQLDLARAAWAILPASLLWGVSFPLALAAVAAPGRDPGRLVGRVYAANTLGGILGAVAFSLWLVPSQGTHTAERVLIGLAAVSASLLLARPAAAARTAAPPDAAAVRPALRWENLGAILAWAAVLAWSVPAAPWGLAAYGRYMATYGNHLRPGVTSAAQVPRQGDAGDVYCLYTGEGVNGTVAVTQTTAGVRNFHSAGKVQASNDPHDMRLQRMLGHLAALAHPNPRNVLVVACGAGVTAGAFVPHPEVKRIVICDIEPLVPRFVAPLFAAENHHVIEDPRTQVVSDDGRHFVRTTREMFDVITSDPIDPWVKGCAALNTVEYYQMCKARLNPGGVMALWIPLYESNQETIKSVLATFFQVFPDGVLWSNDSEGQGYDAVLFGQVGGARFDLDALEERLRRPDYGPVRISMLDAGFGTSADLLGTFAGQAADLAEWTRTAQINTDANLRLQYLAGWSANMYVGGAILDEILRYRRFPDKLFVGSKPLVERLNRRFATPEPTKTPAVPQPSASAKTSAPTDSSAP